MLRTRHAAGIRLDDPIFADTLGGYRDPSNTRRSLRTALSPVGSTARRDLGLTLRALRRQAGLTRKQVAKTLGWPKTRIELIETGRIKVDHQLVTNLVKTYGITLDNPPDPPHPTQTKPPNPPNPTNSPGSAPTPSAKPPPPPSTKPATPPAKSPTN